MPVGILFGTFRRIRVISGGGRIGATGPAWVGIDAGHSRRFRMSLGKLVCAGKVLWLVVWLSLITPTPIDAFSFLVRICIGRGRLGTVVRFSPTRLRRVSGRDMTWWRLWVLGDSILIVFLIVHEGVNEHRSRGRIDLRMLALRIL